MLPYRDIGIQSSVDMMDNVCEPIEMHVQCCSIQTENDVKEEEVQTMEDTSVKEKIEQAEQLRSQAHQIYEEVEKKVRSQLQRNDATEVYNHTLSMELEALRQEYTENNKEIQQLRKTLQQQENEFEDKI